MTSHLFTLVVLIKLNMHEKRFIVILINSQTKIVRSQNAFIVIMLNILLYISRNQNKSLSSTMVRKMTAV